MVVQPNSTIILYRGVPLDNTYSDTVYFSHLSDQIATFQSTYIKRTLTKNTYQRVNSNTFEANCLADDIYDCNYMAFQNTNFGDKWFYAFITSIEYINNQNSLITYEIDVMQTYFFDVILEECLVEREHSETDVIGENILPEPVSLGEYVFDRYGMLGDSTLYDTDVVVMYVDTDGTTANGRHYSGTYSGCSLRAFTNNDAGANGINAFLTQYIQKPESIVNMYTCPHFISHGDPNGWDITMSQANDILSYDYPISFHDLSYVEDYLVKNKKLFTYPYFYIHVDDSNSGVLPFRLEFFENNLPSFSIFGSGNTPVQLTLVPNNYKGGSSTPHGEPLSLLRTEKLTLAEYPICSWNYDTYKAWVAQNEFPMAMNVVKSTIGGLLNSDLGDPTGGSQLTGALSGLATSLIDNTVRDYTASIQPDTIRGSLTNGNALFSHGLLKFNIGMARQPLQIVKVIDDFFNMYGYTTNRVKTPNRAVRPYWCYTKTRGAKIRGYCPTDAIAKMCRIYDKGITFWKNIQQIGDYSLDNRPT